VAFLGTIGIRTVLNNNFFSPPLKGINLFSNPFHAKAMRIKTTASDASEIRVMLEATLDVKSVIIFLTKSHEERRTNVSCFLLKVKRNVKQFLRQSIPFSLNIAISTAEK
jgi:hypothetical protein